MSGSCCSLGFLFLLICTDRHTHMLKYFIFYIEKQYQREYDLSVESFVQLTVVFRIWEFAGMLFL